MKTIIGGGALQAKTYAQFYSEMVLRHRLNPIPKVARRETTHDESLLPERYTFDLGFRPMWRVP